MIPLIISYIGVRKIFQLKLYNRLERYFSIKEFLVRKNILLEDLQKKDRENSEIDILDLEKFTLILRDLSEAYENIWHPMTLINKNSLYFSKFAKKRLDQFILMEKEWLLDYMIVCKSILKSWLNNHMQKLKELEQEMMKDSTHGVGIGQETLKLGSLRLESYINSLEKVLAHI